MSTKIVQLEQKSGIFRDSHSSQTMSDFLKNRLLILHVLHAVISISLTLSNKSIALSFSFPFFVLLVQNLCAAICSIGIVIFYPSTCQKFRISHFPLCSLSTCIFIFAIWLAQLSLARVSIPIYSVASNMRPLCTCMIECILHSRIPSFSRMAGLGLIVLGAAVSAESLDGVAWTGYMTALAYTVTMSLLAVCDNWMYRKLQNDQTVLGLNLYRLLLSLPLLLVLILHYRLRL